MMVMTAKVDFKKIILGLAAAAALILALILLLLCVLPFYKRTKQEP